MRSFNGFVRGGKMQYGLIGEHLPHSFSKVIHEEIGVYDQKRV